MVVGIRLSQLGIILSFGIHLAKSGDILDDQDLGDLYYWYIVGKSQRCCYNAQESPPKQRIIWGKISTVQKSGNPRVTTWQWDEFERYLKVKLETMKKKETSKKMF